MSFHNDIGFITFAGSKKNAKKPMWSMAAPADKT
jgi:hypothetical protein